MWFYRCRGLRLIGSLSSRFGLRFFGRFNFGLFLGLFAFCLLFLFVGVGRIVFFCRFLFLFLLCFFSFLLAFCVYRTSEGCHGFRFGLCGNDKHHCQNDSKSADRARNGNYDVSRAFRHRGRTARNQSVEAIVAQNVGAEGHDVSFADIVVSKLIRQFRNQTAAYSDEFELAEFFAYVLARTDLSVSRVVVIDDSQSRILHVPVKRRKRHAHRGNFFQLSYFGAVVEEVYREHGHCRYGAFLVDAQGLFVVVQRSVQEVVPHVEAVFVFFDSLLVSRKILRIFEVVVVRIHNVARSQSFDGRERKSGGLADALVVFHLDEVVVVILSVSVLVGAENGFDADFHISREPARGENLIVIVFANDTIVPAGLLACLLAVFDSFLICVRGPVDKSPFVGRFAAFYDLFEVVHFDFVLQSRDDFFVGAFREFESYALELGVAEVFLVFVVDADRFAVFGEVVVVVELGFANRDAYRFLPDGDDQGFAVGVVDVFVSGVVEAAVVNARVLNLRLRNEFLEFCVFAVLGVALAHQNAVDSYNEVGSVDGFEIPQIHALSVVNLFVSRNRKFDFNLFLVDRQITGERDVFVVGHAGEFVNDFVGSRVLYAFAVGAVSGFFRPDSACEIVGIFVAVSVRKLPVDAVAGINVDLEVVCGNAVRERRKTERQKFGAALVGIAALFGEFVVSVNVLGNGEAVRFRNDKSARNRFHRVAVGGFDGVVFDAEAFFRDEFNDDCVFARSDFRVEDAVFAFPDHAVNDERSHRVFAEKRRNLLVVLQALNLDRNVAESDSVFIFRAGVCDAHGELRRQNVEFHSLVGNEIEVVHDRVLHADLCFADGSGVVARFYDGCRVERRMSFGVDDNSRLQNSVDNHVVAIVNHVVAESVDFNFLAAFENRGFAAVVKLFDIILFYAVVLHIRKAVFVIGVEAGHFRNGFRSFDSGRRGYADNSSSVLREAVVFVFGAVGVIDHVPDDVGIGCQSVRSLHVFHAVTNRRGFARRDKSVMAGGVVEKIIAVCVFGKGYVVAFSHHIRGVRAFADVLIAAEHERNVAGNSRHRRAVTYPVKVNDGAGSRPCRHEVGESACRFADEDIFARNHVGVGYSRIFRHGSSVVGPCGSGGSDAELSRQNNRSGVVGVVALFQNVVARGGCGSPGGKLDTENFDIPRAHVGACELRQADVVRQGDVDFVEVGNEAVDFRRDGKSVAFFIDESVGTVVGFRTDCNASDGNGFRFDGVVEGFGFGGKRIVRRVCALQTFYADGQSVGSDCAFVVVDNVGVSKKRGVVDFDFFAVHDSRFQIKNDVACVDVVGSVVNFGCAREIEIGKRQFFGRDLPDHFQRIYKRKVGKHRAVRRIHNTENKPRQQNVL